MNKISIYITLLFMALFTCSCAAKPSAKKVVWLGYHESASAIYPTVHYDFQLEEDGTYTLINSTDRSPEEAQIAVVPAEVADRLTEIVAAERMRRYRENYRPLMDIRDGKSWDLSIQFDDESVITSSGYAKRPRGKGLQRLEEYLNEVWAQVKDSAETVNLYEKY